MDKRAKSITSTLIGLGAGGSVVGVFMNSNAFVVLGLQAGITGFAVMALLMGMNQLADRLETLIKQSKSDE